MNLVIIPFRSHGSWFACVLASMSWVQGSGFACLHRCHRLRGSHPPPTVKPDQRQAELSLRFGQEWVCATLKME